MRELPRRLKRRIPSREEQWRRYEELWQEGGGGILLSFPNLLTHEAVNDVACDFVREKISQIVKDPKTAAALSPTGYPLGVKRICVDTNYLRDLPTAKTSNW